MLILKTDQKNAWSEPDVKRPGLIWGVDYVWFYMQDECESYARRYVAAASFDQVGKKEFTDHDFKIFHN